MTLAGMSETSPNTIIAFDADGTLDSSAGPVVWEDEKRAAAAADPPIALGIVSASRHRPRDETPSYLVGSEGGNANLRAFATVFPMAHTRVYVSDNKDRWAAQAVGFLYVDARDFTVGEFVKASERA